jgi:hypothetical protein
LPKNAFFTVLLKEHAFAGKLRRCENRFYHFNRQYRATHPRSHLLRVFNFFRIWQPFRNGFAKELLSFDVSIAQKIEI